MKKIKVVHILTVNISPIVIKIANISVAIKCEVAHLLCILSYLHLTLAILEAKIEVIHTLNVNIFKTLTDRASIILPVEYEVI